MTKSASDTEDSTKSSEINATKTATLLEPAVLQGQEVTYPLSLPIKVAGINHPDLLEAITAICAEFDHTVTEDEMKSKPSSSAKYLSLTFEFHATSREHLNDFYRRLESHELIKWTL